MHISWIVPGLLIGGGGHWNIFRAVYYLERFGHRCDLYFTNITEAPDVIRAKIHQYFYPLAAGVHIYDGTIAASHLVIATHWSTVCGALECATSAAAAPVYFVQDFEPLFYPMGTEYIYAENTYTSGLYCITYGTWCQKILKERYGSEADHVQFALNREIYRPVSVNHEGGLPARVLFLAKPDTPRRCYELGVAALAKLHEIHPAIEIGFVGADNIDLSALPFPVRLHGLMTSLTELADLYRRYTVGIAFSPTNPSSVGYEMMACGLPLVDIDCSASAQNYGNRHDIALLVSANPEIIAKQIGDLLYSPEELASRRENGLQFVSALPSEEESSRQIESLLSKHLLSCTAGEVPSEISWIRQQAFAMVDITSFCNLKCVYCYQSKPDYHGEHATEQHLANLPYQLNNIGVKGITLCGEGEITVFKGWENLATTFYEKGIDYRFLTNLSYTYTDDQILALSRALELYVSFDTFDADLHAKIRRGSNLDIILENLKRIRAAGRLHARHPRITQNCVVSDQNVFELPKLVQAARDQGIDRVALLYLIKNFDDVPGALRVSPIEQLPSPRRDAALASVQQAIDTSNAQSIDLYVSDIFTDMLDSRAQVSDRIVTPDDYSGNTDDRNSDLTSEDMTFEYVDESMDNVVDCAASTDNPSASDLGDITKDESSPWTRICVSPWNGLFVTRRGGIGPCCLLPEYAGNLNTEPLSLIVNGSKLLALRQALLSGDLEHSAVPEVARSCAKCGIYPKGTVNELQLRLNDLRRRGSE